MFKFTALLCALVAVGFVQVARADGLDKAKGEFEKIIDKAINWFKDSIDEYKRIVNDVIENLKRSAEKIKDKIRHQAIVAVDEAIRQMSAEREAVDSETDVSSCDAILSDALKAHESYVKDVVNCADGKVKQGLGYVKNITDAADKVLQEFAHKQDEAKECLKFDNVIKAVVCVNGVGIKASLASAKTIPTVIKSIGNIAAMVQGLPATLPACIVGSSVATTEELIGQGIDNFRGCIAQKLNDAKEKLKQQ